MNTSIKGTLSLLTLTTFTSINAYANTMANECELYSSSSSCAAVEHIMNKNAEFDTDFERYKMCEEAAYQLFNAEQTCEYEAFIRQAEAEFSAYKEKVGAIWDKPNFSDKKNWVSYSPSLKVKKEIDFEKNVVKITRIQEKGSTASVDELKKEIVNTTELSVAEAQKADPFIGKIISASQPEQLSSAPLLPVAQDKTQAAKEQQILLDSAKVTETTDSKGQTLVTIEAPFPTSWLSRKEKQFIEPVQDNAERFDLHPSFILSIIRTESNFNPTAVSHIPAFGLMQVVPTSAGLDATNYLFGEQTKLSRDYLFTPEKNIEVGSAYLYLLSNRYFKGISNEESLKYCTIAAYNGGMAPIYRIFGKGSRKKAIAHINTLEPSEVYSQIIKQHPATETRNYLKRVTKAESNYLKNI